MDRLVYTALTGLQRAQEAQGVTANNLANLSTPGFRREMAALSAGFLAEPGTPAAARVQAGGEAVHALMQPGRVEQTGRPLDIALDGGAWLAVADATGAEALTRRGDLRLSADGALQTGDGRPVLGEDGAPVQLATGFQSLRIGRTGTLETRPADDAPWLEVGRLRLVTPDPATLSRGEDGLFRSPDAAPDAAATVTTGALERANVEPAEALVELVQQSRGFEMQTRLITTARELDEASAALMRVQ